MAAPTQLMSSNTVAPTAPVVVRVGANAAAAADKAVVPVPSLPIAAADGHQPQSRDVAPKSNTSLSPEAMSILRQMEEPKVICSSTEAMNILRRLEEQRATGPYTCLFGQPADGEAEEKSVPESMLAQFSSAINDHPQDLEKKKKEDEKQQPKRRRRDKKSTKKKRKPVAATADASSDSDAVVRGSDIDEDGEEEAEAAPEETESAIVVARKTTTKKKHRRPRGGRNGAPTQELQAFDLNFAANAVAEIFRRVAVTCFPQQQFPAIQWQPQPAIIPEPQQPAVPVQPQNFDSLTVPAAEWENVHRGFEQLQIQNAELSQQLQAANQFPRGDLQAAMRKVLEIAQAHDNEIMIDGQIYGVRRKNPKVGGERKRGRPPTNASADSERIPPDRKKRMTGKTRAARPAQEMQQAQPVPTPPQLLPPYPHPLPGNNQNVFAPIVDPNNPDAPVQVLGMPVPPVPQQYGEMTFVDAAGQLNYDFVPPQPLPATMPNGMPDPNLGGLFGGDITPSALGDTLDFPQS